MIHRALADAVVILHAGFVAFVMLGGLLALRWRRALWLHAPAALWGAAAEFGGLGCPLTPLENWLRAQGAGSGYRGDFVARYLLPALYPAELTRGLQIALGIMVLAVNLAVYGLVLTRRSSRSKIRPSKR